MHLDVLQIPFVDLGPNQNLCESELPFSLDAGAGMSDYNWSNGGSTQIQDVTVSGTYAVTVTSTDGCTAQDDVLINIIPLSMPVFPDFGPYCQNNTPAELNSTSDNGISGSWSPSEISTSSPGTQTYTFTPDASECASVCTTDVLVNEITSPQFSDFGPYCIGDQAESLPLTSINGVSGQWQPENISTETAGLTNYHFIPDSNQSCVDDYTENVMVYAYPEITLWVADSVMYSSQSVSLIAEGADEFVWNPADMLTCQYCSDPTFLAPENQVSTEEYLIYVSASNNACVSTDSVILTVLADEPLVIPQGFSPNGDGVGEAWEIQGLQPYPDASVSIFNRWGNLVYQAEPYHNQWRGRNESGNLLPAGTYYYVLMLNDGSGESLTGYVYINY